MPVNELYIKAVILDDEVEACENLQNILYDYVDANIHIIGVAYNSIDGERLIAELKPDVVFLDIEMPDENAFQFLQRIAPFNFEIIFVTAYDEFAVKAFRLNALDYILKPIDIDELTETIKKLKSHLYSKSLLKNEDQLNVLRQIAQKEQSSRLTLKSSNHLEVVDFKDICYIVGQGSYCKISFIKSGVTKHITTSNIIAYYEDILPRELFYRVHKSYLVNCSQINEIMVGESPVLLLKNQEKVPISRRRHNDFIEFVKENNF